MKLLIENMEVFSCEKIGKNWNQWNDIQNSFNLKIYDYKHKFPKHLLICALRRFNEIADTYCIDASKFKYIRISNMDVTSQVDFHCDTDSTGPNFSIYGIYYSSKNKSIMQSCYAMG